MYSLDPNDPLKQQLDNHCRSVAETANACIKTFLNKECSICNDWETIDRLDGNFSHNIFLGASNKNFKALAVLGMSTEVIQEFIQSTVDTDILDAFGEMLNIFYAMLLDNSEFENDFGILLQSFPQYSSEINFYPRAWGCNGTLVTPGNVPIYIGIAIKKCIVVQ
jgi:hypothetical protein